MKQGKLYIKIFLSFLGILFICELLIFALFIITAGRTFRDRFHQYTEAKVLVAKRFIEDRINGTIEPASPRNDPVEDALIFLGKTYRVKLWLTDQKGRIVNKSFQGEPPSTDGFERQEHGPYLGGLMMDHRMRGGLRVYATVPLDAAPGRPTLLHAFFSDTERGRSHAVFGLGLVMIGLVVALLVIPVSRLISKPVNRLRGSALRIAEGDLDHRIDLKSKDEIGELGQAFNHMADKLWGMIQSGKKLTANVSHELRSPLARIRVAEELIRDKLAQRAYDSCEPYLDSIREEIGELDRLIGRILELSKLDLKDEPYAYERVDLTDILKEVLSRFEPAFRQKRLRIFTHLPENAFIHGEKVGLLSAFSNVFDNAAKFTPEEGVFSVDVHGEPAGINIALTNTSGALPEEELARIFDPFHRIAESEIQGTGLGLSITRKIIEKHGGSIQASNSAEGFRIEIVFPADAGGNLS